jgi:hypothetical protein
VWKLQSVSEKIEGDNMTHETDHKSIEDLVVSNAIQFDTLFRLMLDKGIFTETEFDEKLKEVQAYYQRYDNGVNA